MRVSRETNQFDIPENKVLGLAGKKVGERFRGLLNYKCIEKTKNFTMVRISMVAIVQTKRVF